MNGSCASVSCTLLLCIIHGALTCARKHGTFRPKLLSLVQSNDAETVLENITKAHNLPQASIVDVLPALKILTQLKGVGPATASLLLSVLNPTDAPFFSDELFRWCCWDEPGGGGWKRGIKYTAKEYVMVVEKVMEIRRRLGMKHIQAVHVEKVAWVLGKEGIDVDNGEDDEEGGGKEDEEVKEMVGTKRKAGDEDILVKTRSKMPKKTARKKDINSPAAGARRSTRTKK